MTRTVAAQKPVVRSEAPMGRTFLKRHSVRPNLCWRSQPSRAASLLCSVLDSGAQSASGPDISQPHLRCAVRMLMIASAAWANIAGRLWVAFHQRQGEGERNR
jgi:hypothetical protein